MYDVEMNPDPIIQRKKQQALGTSRRAWWLMVKYTEVRVLLVEGLVERLILLPQLF